MRFQDFAALSRSCLSLFVPAIKIAVIFTELIPRVRGEGGTQDLTDLNWLWLTLTERVGMGNRYQRLPAPDPTDEFPWAWPHTSRTIDNLWFVIRYPTVEDSTVRAGSLDLSTAFLWREYYQFTRCRLWCARRNANTMPRRYYRLQPKRSDYQDFLHFHLWSILKHWMLCVVKDSLDF